MSKQRKALQAALEAMEYLESQPHVRGKDDCYEDLIAEIRAALAEPEEPVDDVWFEDLNGAGRKSPKDCQRFGANGVPEAVWVNGNRYTLRKWVSLTDEEIFALRDAHAAHLSWGVRDFACAIEAALKEKNA